MLDWIAGSIDGAVQGSTEALQEALSATTGLVTAVQEQVAASAQLVTDGITIAGDLFEASVDIGVAYLVKLIVLPVLILAGILWLFRSLTHSGGDEILERAISSDPQVENGQRTLGHSR